MALIYHRKKDGEKDKNTADPWKLAGYGLGYDKDELPPTPLSESVTGMFKDEQIACWLDGDAPESLNTDVLHEIQHNDTFAAFIALASHTDTQGERSGRQTYPKPVPLGSKAATGTDGLSHCGIRCELYIMQRLGFAPDAQEWEQRAKTHGWLSDRGMSMGCIGNALTDEGLAVERHFDATTADLQTWLGQGKEIIAVVDGGELLGNRKGEQDEDRYVGEIPDHAVVILGIDSTHSTVTLHDPQSGQQTDTYPAEQFEDAWDDSCRYAIVISRPATDAPLQV